MFVDSHCHLDCLKLDRHNGSLDAALEAARARGVGHFLCISIELETFPEVLRIAERYDDVLPPLVCTHAIRPLVSLVLMSY